MINQLNHVRAFAPASCANLAVGFDILGFSLCTLGDEFSLKRMDSPGLRLYFEDNNRLLPVDLSKNTATVALLAMMKALGIEQGFEVHLQKRIPLSAGLGGSAASAVAAVVALNGFLKQPLSLAELLPYALTGEEAASGARHADNVVPCLYGGLQLIRSIDPLDIIALPALPIHAVFVRPEWQVKTRDARQALPPYVNLDAVIRQTANLAGFISALYEKDYQRLADCCKDVLIEPRRAHLIPYFYDMQQLALKTGAMVCSISGSGPVLFALTDSEKKAIAVGRTMRQAYNDRNIDSQMFVSPMDCKGAYIMETGT